MTAQIFPLPAPTRDLLGQRLLRRGTITRLQLEQALTLQQHSGGRVGEILYSLGYCNSLDLHRELAAQQDMPFADLLQEPPAPELLLVGHLPDYLRLECLPWRRRPDGELVLACVEPTEAVRHWAAQHYPHHSFALTARRDINQTLSTTFADALSALSREALWQADPMQSARSTLAARQRGVLLAGFAVLAAGLWWHPAITLVTLFMGVNGFYLVTLAFKALLFEQGIRYRVRLWHTEAPPIADADLPVYTILIPLYREAAGIPHILAALRRLDYPRSKLDIKLVLEGDDAATIEAARTAQAEGMFEIVIVPPSQPRTKPKACNYALRFARGEIVTIYDAEDRPDPQQLRRVAQKFRAADADVVCIQCRLNYYNRGRNLLTRLFAIEYASWFDYMLPGLESLNLPIPLGGTSNHIALDRLRELGEWDPYNVTEDADLGIRMAVAKYRTLTLESLTEEEAPVTLWAWMKQRSRWVKGYMQTWLVHMRRPRQLFQKLGWKKFLGFQFFIGGPCLVFLTTPVMIFLSAMWVVGGFSLAHPLAPFISPLSIMVLVYGVVLHLIFAQRVVKDSRWDGMALAMLAFPFYWLLHSLASFRGLWQLITRPHYWDKTEHGIDP